MRKRALAAAKRSFTARGRCEASHIAVYPPHPASGVTLQHIDFAQARDRAHDFPFVIAPDFVSEDEEAMLVKYFHRQLRK